MAELQRVPGVLQGTTDEVLRASAACDQGRDTQRPELDLLLTPRGCGPVLTSTVSTNGNLTSYLALDQGLCFRTLWGLPSGAPIIPQQSSISPEECQGILENLNPEEREQYLSAERWQKLRSHLSIREIEILRGQNLSDEDLDFLIGDLEKNGSPRLQSHGMDEEKTYEILSKSPEEMDIALSALSPEELAGFFSSTTEEQQNSIPEEIREAQLQRLAANPNLLLSVQQSKVTKTLLFASTIRRGSEINENQARARYQSSLFGSQGARLEMQGFGIRADAARAVEVPAGEVLDRSMEYRRVANLLERVSEHHADEAQSTAAAQAEQAAARLYTASSSALFEREVPIFDAQAGVSQVRLAGEEFSAAARRLDNTERVMRGVRNTCVVVVAGGVATVAAPVVFTAAAGFTGSSVVGVAASTATGTALGAGTGFFYGGMTSYIEAGGQVVLQNKDGAEARRDAWQQTMQDTHDGAIAGTGAGMGAGISTGLNPAVAQLTTLQVMRNGAVSAASSSLLTTTISMGERIYQANSEFKSMYANSNLSEEQIGLAYANFIKQKGITPQELAREGGMNLLMASFFGASGARFEVARQGAAGNGFLRNAAIEGSEWSVSTLVGFGRGYFETPEDQRTWDNLLVRATDEIAQNTISSFQGRAAAGGTDRPLGGAPRVRGGSPDAQTETHGSRIAGSNDAGSVHAAGSPERTPGAEAQAPAFSESDQLFHDIYEGGHPSIEAERNAGGADTGEMELIGAGVSGRPPELSAAADDSAYDARPQTGEGLGAEPSWGNGGEAEPQNEFDSQRSPRGDAEEGFVGGESRNSARASAEDDGLDQPGRGENRREDFETDESVVSKRSARDALPKRSEQKWEELRNRFIKEYKEMGYEECLELHDHLRKRGILHTSGLDDEQLSKLNAVGLAADIAARTNSPELSSIEAKETLASTLMQVEKLTSTPIAVHGAVNPGEDLRSYIPEELARVPEVIEHFRNMTAAAEAEGWFPTQYMEPTPDNCRILAAAARALQDHPERDVYSTFELAERAVAGGRMDKEFARGLEEFSIPVGRDFSKERPTALEAAKIVHDMMSTSAGTSPIPDNAQTRRVLNDAVAALAGRDGVTISDIQRLVGEGSAKNLEYLQMLTRLRESGCTLEAKWIHSPEKSRRSVERSQRLVCTEIPPGEVADYLRRADLAADKLCSDENFTAGYGSAEEARRIAEDAMDAATLLAVDKVRDPRTRGQDPSRLVAVYQEKMTEILNTAAQPGSSYSTEDTAQFVRDITLLQEAGVPGTSRVVDNLHQSRQGGTYGDPAGFLCEAQTAMKMLGSEWSIDEMSSWRGTDVDIRATKAKVEHYIEVKRSGRTFVSKNAIADQDGRPILKDGKVEVAPDSQLLRLLENARRDGARPMVIVENFPSDPQGVQQMQELLESAASRTGGVYPGVYTYEGNKLVCKIPPKGM